jgi:hypothetical protein
MVLGFKQNSVHLRAILLSSLILLNPFIAHSGDIEFSDESEGSGSVKETQTPRESIFKSESSAQESVVTELKSQTKSGELPVALPMKQGATKQPTVMVTPTPVVTPPAAEPAPQATPNLTPEPAKHAAVKPGVTMTQMARKIGIKPAGSFAAKYAQTHPQNILTKSEKKKEQGRMPASQTENKNKGGIQTTIVTPSAPNTPNTANTPSAPNNTSSGSNTPK